MIDVPVKIKISIDTDDVVQVIDTNDVHYRIIYSSDKRAVAVCVQWFDYMDYNEFIGDILFANESDAEEAARIMNAVGVDIFRDKENVVEG